MRPSPSPARSDPSRESRSDERQILPHCLSAGSPVNKPIRQPDKACASPGPRGSQDNDVPVDSTIHPCAPEHNPERRVDTTRLQFWKKDGGWRLSSCTVRRHTRVRKNTRARELGIHAGIICTMTRDCRVAVLTKTSAVGAATVTSVFVSLAPRNDKSRRGHSHSCTVCGCTRHPLRKQPSRLGFDTAAR